MVEIWQNIANETGRKQGLVAKWGVNETTARRWVREKKKLEEAEKHGKGTKMTVVSDPLQRILVGLLLFYEANLRIPRDLKLPITGKYK